MIILDIEFNEETVRWDIFDVTLATDDTSEKRELLRGSKRQRFLLLTNEASDLCYKWDQFVKFRITLTEECWENDEGEPHEGT